MKSQIIYISLDMQKTVKTYEEVEEYIRENPNQSVIWMKMNFYNGSEYSVKFSPLEVTFPFRQWLREHMRFVAGQAKPFDMSDEDYEYYKALFEKNGMAKSTATILKGCDV